MKTMLLASAAAGLLVSAAIAVTSPAFAGDNTPPPPPQGPQAIAWADVKAEADRLWTRLDANGDGKVDAADREARALQRFAEIDANHDGMISKDEFLAHMRAHRPPEPGDAPPPPPPGAGPHPMGPHPMGPHGRFGPPFVDLAILHPALREARANDAVTRAAFDAAVKARFDKLDTNHDGTIDGAERRAAWPRPDHGPGGWRHDGPPPPPPHADGEPD